MLEYLSTVFGSNITSSEYKLARSLPIFILRAYSAEELELNGSKCVLVSPLNETERLPVLKKAYFRITEACDIPCALNLKNLTSAQRSNLIQENIPFVSDRQIYLPFWGSVFTEIMHRKQETPERMTPSTQQVFLKLYYKLSSGEKVNSAIIAEALHMPKSTVSRAVQELEGYGLINVSKDGVNKWIGFADNSETVLNNAIDVMRNPVRNALYLKSLPREVQYKLGHIRGLSELSMLGCSERDGAYVFSKENSQKLSEREIISKRDFDDFGGISCEVWSYEPELLTDGPVVDDISLYICLKDYGDERVQKELDVIREKYGIGGDN